MKALKLSHLWGAAWGKFLKLAVSTSVTLFMLGDGCGFAQIEGTASSQVNSSLRFELQMALHPSGQFSFDTKRSIVPPATRPSSSIRRKTLLALGLGVVAGGAAIVAKSGVEVSHGQIHCYPFPPTPCYTPYYVTHERSRFKVVLG
jgi:hypothetical protein